MGREKLMDIMQIMETRHAVRSYTDEPIAEADAVALQEMVDRCNEESGLHCKLVLDEPKAFDSMLARYGKFANVRNYLVLAGPPTADLEKRCGYFGERLVLFAQERGLNTCWVALTFKKRFVRKVVDAGDKFVLVIALGHGATQGAAHKSKDVSDVVSFQDVDLSFDRDADSESSRSADSDPEGPEEASPIPEWFARGVKAALLAPTAMNQQSFEIILTSATSPEGKSYVDLVSKGGAYSSVDIGIVQLHFELGASTENFAWR